MPLRFSVEKDLWCRDGIADLLHHGAGELGRKHGPVASLKLPTRVRVESQAFRCIRSSRQSPLGSSPVRSPRMDLFARVARLSRWRHRCPVRFCPHGRSCASCCSGPPCSGVGVDDFSNSAAGDETMSTRHARDCSDKAHLASQLTECLYVLPAQTPHRHVTSARRIRRSPSCDAPSTFAGTSTAGRDQPAHIAQPTPSSAATGGHDAARRGSERRGGGSDDAATARARAFLPAASAAQSTAAASSATGCRA